MAAQLDIYNLKMNVLASLAAKIPNLLAKVGNLFDSGANGKVQADLEEEIQTTEQNLKDTIKAKEKLEELIRQKESEISAKEVALAQEKERVDAEVTAAQERKKEAEENLEQCRLALEELQREVQQLESEVASLEKSLAGVTESLNAAAVDATKLANDLAAAKQALEKSTAEKAELELQIQDVIIGNRSIEAELRRCQGAQQSVKQEIDDLNGQTLSLGYRMASAEQDRESAESEIKAMESQVQKLQAELAHYTEIANNCGSLWANILSFGLTQIGVAVAQGKCRSLEAQLAVAQTKLSAARNLKLKAQESLKQDKVELNMIEIKLAKKQQELARHEADLGRQEEKHAQGKAEHEKLQRRNSAITAKFHSDTGKVTSLDTQLKNAGASKESIEASYKQAKDKLTAKQKDRDTAQAAYDKAEAARATAVLACKVAAERLKVWENNSADLVQEKVRHGNVKVDLARKAEAAKKFADFIGVQGPALNAHKEFQTQAAQFAQQHPEEVAAMQKHLEELVRELQNQAKATVRA